MSDLHLHRPAAMIAYASTGAGVVRPTVVALHGLTSSRAAEDASGIFDWTGVTKSGRRLVRFDARGHGASVARPDPDDFAWPYLAADLLALLDVVSPEGPVDAIGASMGVGTLIWAAVEHPERFRRLALVIPPTAWATRAGQGDVYRAAATLVEEQGVDAWVRAAAAMPPHPILEAGGWALTPNPDVPAETLPALLRGAAATDLPPEESVAFLKHETLLLPWAADPGHPVSTAERLAELLPNSTLEIATTPEAIRGWGERIVAFFDA